MKDLRVAWLLPTAWFYWQPLMSEFTKLFPHTRVFTALFPGFSNGLENSIAIEVIGQPKKLEFKPESTSYSSHFTYLSPRITIELLRFRPQIIFTSSFGVWSVLALLFKPLGRWKVIIAYEGSSPTVDYRNSPLRLAIRRAMVRMSDACISNSQAGKNYLIECLKAKPNGVFARPYEVPDISSWSQSAIANKSEIDNFEGTTFLFVGKITPRKGLHILLEACVLLRQKGFDDYTVLIIGDGEQRAELEDFCREHSLGDRVCWLGKINYDRLGKYFEAADVFVSPTLEDTWGMVILEAMLWGKPILCSTAAGASELVSDGDNGYCFAPDNPQLLAEYAIDYINHSEISMAMGQRSRQLIAKHSPEKAAAFLAEIVAFVSH